jgi:phage portal protein BeeE
VPSQIGIEFDIDCLARMDTKTKMAIQKDGVAGGIFSPNEARAAFDKKPKPGGDSVYLQQQMYSLEALAKRDTADAPPASPAVTPLPAAPAAPQPKMVELSDVIEKTDGFFELIRKAA